MTKDEFFALHNITEADFHPAPDNEADELADIREALRILLGGETE